MKRYVDELKTELEEEAGRDARAQPANRRRRIHRHRRSGEDVRAAIRRSRVPPYINFAPLENGSEAYTKAAQRYRKAVQQAQRQRQRHGNRLR